jgi:hypothetical protein
VGEIWREENKQNLQIRHVAASTTRVNQGVQPWVLQRPLARPLSKGHCIGISCSHRFIAKITERGVRLIDEQKMKAFQGKAGSDRVPLVEAAGLNALSV